MNKVHQLRNLFTVLPASTVWTRIFADPAVVEALSNTFKKDLEARKGK